MINLPVVLAIGAAAVTAWIAPAASVTSLPSRRDRFDVPGLLALLVGLSGLTIGLMQANEWGWTDYVSLLFLAAGGVGIAGFLAVESCRAQPLIDLRLFRIPAFAGGVLIFFVFQFDKIVVFVFVPLYLQQQLQLSPIEAGLPLVVATLPTLVTSLAAGRSTDRFGAQRPTMAGLFFNGSALLLVGFAAATGSYPTMVVALILWGAVLPFASVVPRHALMSAVPENRQGQASGLNLTVQMTGGTIGMALATIILSATGDFSLIFWVTAVLVIACILVAWLTVDRKRRT